MARTAEEIAALAEKRARRELDDKEKSRAERQRKAGRTKRIKMQGGTLLQELGLSPQELRWLADPKNRATLAKLMSQGTRAPVTADSGPDLKEAAE